MFLFKFKASSAPSDLPFLAQILEDAWLKLRLHTAINREIFISWCMLYTKVTKCIREKMTLYFRRWTIKSHSPRYKKVGVLPIWIVKSNVSSIGPSSERKKKGPMLETLDYTIRIPYSQLHRPFCISICTSCSVCLTCFSKSEEANVGTCIQAFLLVQVKK